MIPKSSRPLSGFARFRLPFFTPEGSCCTKVTLLCVPSPLVLSDPLGLELFQKDLKPVEEVSESFAFPGLSGLALAFDIVVFQRQSASSISRRFRNEVSPIVSYRGVAKRFPRNREEPLCTARPVQHGNSPPCYVVEFSILWIQKTLFEKKVGKSTAYQHVSKERKELRIV